MENKTALEELKFKVESGNIDLKTWKNIMSDPDRMEYIIENYFVNLDRSAKQFKIGKKMHTEAMKDEEYAKVYYKIANRKKE